jgi:hypothetical protein
MITTRPGNSSEWQFVPSISIATTTIRPQFFLGPSFFTQSSSFSQSHNHSPRFTLTLYSQFYSQLTVWLPPGGLQQQSAVKINRRVKAGVWITFLPLGSPPSMIFCSAVSWRLKRQENRSTSFEGSSIVGVQEGNGEAASPACGWTATDIYRDRVGIMVNKQHACMRILLDVPWLWRLVAGLSPRSPVFSPGSLRMGFVVDKVAIRQVFLRVIRFSLVSTFPPWISILI